MIVRKMEKFYECIFLLSSLAVVSIGQRAEVQNTCIVECDAFELLIRRECNSILQQYRRNISSQILDLKRELINIMEHTNGKRSSPVPINTGISKEDDRDIQYSSPTHRASQRKRQSRGQQDYKVAEDRTSVLQQILRLLKLTE